MLCQVENSISPPALHKGMKQGGCESSCHSEMHLTNVCIALKIHEEMMLGFTAAHHCDELRSDVVETPLLLRPAAGETGREMSALVPALDAERNFSGGSQEIIPGGAERTLGSVESFVRGPMSGEQAHETGPSAWCFEPVIFDFVSKSLSNTRRTDSTRAHTWDKHPRFLVPVPIPYTPTKPGDKSLPCAVQY